jgi:hypothetical protein
VVDIDPKTGAPITRPNTDATKESGVASTESKPFDVTDPGVPPTSSPKDFEVSDTPQMSNANLVPESSIDDPNPDIKNDVIKSIERSETEKDEELNRQNLKDSVSKAEFNELRLSREQELLRNRKASEQPDKQKEINEMVSSRDMSEATRSIENERGEPKEIQHGPLGPEKKWSAEKTQLSEEMSRILVDYDRSESNIPLNHHYWALRNQFHSMT